ncbi:MAG: radical SAM protein [Chloroflexi bacterium]|nr:radical SAM protein [Chloroflexota bacterium]
MNLRNLKTLPNLVSNRLMTLPLVVLYLTDGCNSKCAMCDIWKAPRVNMDMALVDDLVRSCQQLDTRMVLLSGGEAMQHPEWPAIAHKFRAAGIKVWMLTNGLLLRKQARDVSDTIDSLTVSHDAATPDLYHQIRGVDGLDLLLDGMQLVSKGGVPVSTRTTLMRINYHQMPDIVDVALEAGARQVSFLAVDTVNPYAFGPRFEDGVIPLTNTSPFGGLLPEDLPKFAAVLDRMEIDYAAHFADGRIAESPQKLRRLYDYFAEPLGEGEFEPPRCNAPHISLVVNVDGRLQPCYFLPSWGNLDGQTLVDALNDEEAMRLREAYRSGERHECKRCVCPLYRGPRSLLKGW